MSLIIAIASVVGLVWGTLFVARGSLISGCLIVLLLTCCFGPHFLSFDVGGITLTLDRVGLLALIAAFVVQWRLGRVEIKPLGRVDYLLLGFVGVLIVSTFTHDWRSNTIGGAENHTLQHLINGYLIPLVLYFIARQSPLNEKSVTRITAALACFGVYLAATGIFEAMGQWSLVFPKYIADPEVGLHFGRARGPMVQSVSYGVYLATSLLCVWLWRDRLARHWQLILFMLVPAFLAAIFFCKTRSVWLGSMTGMLILTWFALKGRWRVAVIGSVIVAGLIFVAVKKENLVAFDRGTSAENTRRSTSMRGSFAYVSWLMFQDQPLFGFGFGQFAKEKLPYLSDRTTELNLESIRAYVHHNTFLSVLTETGLVGLAFFVAVLGGWIYCGYTMAKRDSSPLWMRRHGMLLLGVLGIAFWQMMGHEITFTPLDNSLIFFIAGVTIGLSRSPSVAAERRRIAPSNPVASPLRPSIS